jgi:CRP-like cAMP-binding protein
MSAPAAPSAKWRWWTSSGRSATATAETDCAWLLIGRNEFLAMVKTRPAFGIALMRSLSARVLHIGKLLGG